MKMRIAALLVIAVAVGFGLGWLSKGRASETELRSIILAHQLERLGFSANGLLTLEAGHEDRLQNLLWFGITSSLKNAERQIAAGAKTQPNVAIPNLLEAATRARKVAEDAGRSDLALRIQALQENVSKRKLGGTSK